MDERLARQYWWEAFLASAREFRRASPGSWSAASVAEFASDDADAALAAFEKRWPEKEVPHGE